MKAVIRLLKWVQAYPLKAVGMTFAFTLLGSIVAVTNNTVAAIAGLLCAIGIAYVVRDSRKVSIILAWIMAVVPCRLGAQEVLIVSPVQIGLDLAPDVPEQSIIASAEEQPPEPVYQEAIVVIVLVFGIVVIITMVRFCQKHFPKPPATPPPEDGATETNSPPTFGGIHCYSANGSCYQPALFPSFVGDAPALSGITLRAVVRENNGQPAVELNPAYVMDERDFLTESDYAQWLAEYGLSFPHSPGEEYFSVEGQPATKYDVPIYFDILGAVAEEGRNPLTFDLGTGPLYTVVLQKSENMVTWSHMLKATVSANTPFYITDDGPKNQCFFRALVYNNDTTGQP